MEPLSPRAAGRGSTRSCPRFRIRTRSLAQRFQIEAIGGLAGAVLRISVTNRDTRPHQLLLRCDSSSWGENPAWIDPAECRGDNLVAGWNERADRVLVLGLGRRGVLPSTRRPCAWSQVHGHGLESEAGRNRQGWIVRPYRAYAADLPSLPARLVAGNGDCEARMARPA